MKTCAEELPIEIWLMSFRYLEAHDLFHGFHHLNNYFDQILASNHLSFYVRLKQNDNNHLQCPTSPYWCDSVLNRIVCLRAPVQCRSTYFLQFLHFHINKLTRLQSLSIKIWPLDTLYTPYICDALKELYCLRYLSLICTPNHNLFKSILAIRTLRICYLSLRESTTTINCQFDVNNTIKQLFIIFINNVDNSIINLLLLHMSKLKRIEISGSYFTFNQSFIFDKQLFTLPELRTLKLKFENAHFISDCFKCLHSIFPILKHFYFHYEKQVLPITFLDSFISYWWPIIEQIQYININIKGRVSFDTMDNDTQINLQNNRQNLLDKSSQFKESFQVKWTEQAFARSKYVEITIIKS